jgi:branched-chain amino acid transport system permease protein
MSYARRIGLLALLALTLAFPLLSDSANISIAIFTLIFAIAATSWNMFSGYTGYLSLGHMVYYGLGAYALATICQDWHVPGGSLPLLLLPLVGLIAGACAIPLGWLALRTRQHTFMVITIAMFFLFQILAYNLPATNGSAGQFLPNPPWDAATFDLPFYYAACSVLLLATTASWWVRHSKFGLGLLAIRDDEDRALGLGVKTGAFKLAAYVLSAFFLGMAGALSAYFVGVIYPPTVFDPASNVIVIAMVFLGGVGTLAGPLLGAALLEPLQQVLTGQFSALPGVNLVVYGSILLMVVLWLPRGIVPTLAGSQMPTGLHLWKQAASSAREAWLPLARLLAESRFSHWLSTTRGWVVQAASQTSLPGGRHQQQYQASLPPPAVLPVAHHVQEEYHPGIETAPVSQLALRLAGDHQRLSSSASGQEPTTIRFDPAHAVQFTLEVDPARGLVTIAAGDTVAPSPHLLPREEWQRVLVEWNKTSTPYPKCCVQHLFEEQARQHPAATAVVCSWQAQSYQALNLDANRLAHYLQRLEVEPETLVVICMERSLELITSVLAVLKAGGAFLLLDPQQPPSQLARQLEYSGTSLILTQAALARSLAPAFVGVRLVRVDTEWQSAIAGLPSSEPRASTLPVHTACAVSKDSTSAAPCFVRLSHEGIVNLHVAQRQVLALRSTDRVLQGADPHTDAFLFEVFMGLLVGATLVLAPEPPGRASSPQLQRLLQEERITLAALDGDRWADLSAEAAPQLRIALSWASSPFPVTAVERWLTPGRRMLTLYGAAETACWATAAECVPSGHASSLLGRPVANRQVYVLDPEMRPLAVGEPGQIYIGGVGLGHYHRRYDLNTQRFVPDPFRTDPTARLYRTEHSGCWRGDASLEVLVTVHESEAHPRN